MVKAILASSDKKVQGCRETSKVLFVINGQHVRISFVVLSRMCSILSKWSSREALLLAGSMSGQIVLSRSDKQERTQA